METEFIYINCCVISMEENTGHLHQLLFHLHGGMYRSYVNCLLIIMVVDTGRLCQLLLDLQGGRHRLYMSIVV